MGKLGIEEESIPTRKYFIDDIFYQSNLLLERELEEGSRNNYHQLEKVFK